MNTTVLLVKNMVCQRCIMAVEAIVQSEKIPFHKVVFGEIHLKDVINENQKQDYKPSLVL